MKIIGILLLALGLLLSAGGLWGTFFNLNEMKDPGGMCSHADQKFSEAQAAVRQYEAAKGTPGELSAKQNADTKLRVQRIAQDGCADMKGTYQTYAIVSGIACVIGIALFITGIFLWKRGGRQSNVSADLASA